jgi:uncharacterized membrane protein
MGLALRAVISLSIAGAIANAWDHDLGAMVACIVGLFISSISLALDVRGSNDE